MVNDRSVSIFQIISIIIFCFLNVQAYLPTGYLGCYGDNPWGVRALQHKANVSDLNHGDACILQCYLKRYRFAGTKYVGCFCGNAVHTGTYVSGCKYECPGDRDELCGGPWGMSVYATEEISISTSPSTLVSTTNSTAAVISKTFLTAVTDTAEVTLSTSYRKTTESGTQTNKQFTTGQTVKYISPEHPGSVNYALHDLYSDGVLIRNNSAISFQVKCERNAYILLQEYRHVYKNLAVEIILGTSENTGISISDKQSKRYTWCHAPYIVSKYEYRYFWISWKDNVVRVGKGDRPNINAFLCAEKISCAINFISIGTSNYTKGYWKFNTGPPAAVTSTTTNTLSESSATNPLTSKAMKTPVSTNGTDEGNLTAVYIAVPVTAVVLIVIVAAFLLLRRYQRSHKAQKPESDVVYRNETLTVNRNMTSGIENPVYDEHVLDKQKNANYTSGESSRSSNNDYAEIHVTEEQAVESPTNEYATINLKSESDAMPVYTNLIKQNEEATSSDATASDETPKTDVNNKATSHIASIPAEGSGFRTKLDEDYSKVEKSEADANADGDIEEDQNTQYDHTSVGGIGPAVTVRDDYAHLDDTQ